MQLSGGGAGARNAYAAWRMAVARRAAGAYEGNRNLAALAVAGSVGAGLADRFSDLELDGSWIGPPTGRDRVAPVHGRGALRPQVAGRGPHAIAGSRSLRDHDRAEED